MGRAKALLPLGVEETFISRIVATLREADVEDVVVVVGHEPDSIIAALERDRAAVRVVVNEEYERGPWTSLTAGLRVIDRPGVVAALVTLVAVPLVRLASVHA